MPASIGVNLRVTGHCRQGGRKYMEDFFSVAYQQTEDERDLEYAFFGIYDGHGGAEAAAFAKEHLMETIIKHKSFWSDNDEDVLRAIKDGYIATHYAMWKEQEKWPRTASGLPSTAGTTASVAFIRRGKIYIGHVGDSGIIMGYQDGTSGDWRARPLTRDHKPENVDEMVRINRCGGKVVAKSGVPRVVWNRPKMGHQGPVRRSTPIDEIPFLAVARSLGDLWSYNSQINQFIVSPDPDCSVLTIDTNVHRCLVFGTDGLFNMLTPQNAVYIVQQAEAHNEQAALSDSAMNKTWLNPSKLLVEKALERWHNTKMRADNTSVVTLMLDPPGPPRAQVLKNRKKNTYPDSGLKIMTRYEEQENQGLTVPSGSQQSGVQGPVQSEKEAVTEEGNVSSSEVSSLLLDSLPLKERNFASCSKPRDSTSFDPRVEADESGVAAAASSSSSSSFSSSSSTPSSSGKENCKRDDASIQINEISSSSTDFTDENAEEVEALTTTSNRHLRSSSGSAGSGKSTEAKLQCKGKRPKEASPSTSGGGGDDCCDEDSKPRKSGRIVKTIFEKEKPVKKFSLAQKILRSKKLSLKKAAPLKKKLKLKQKVKKEASRKKGRRKGLRSPKSDIGDVKPIKSMPKRSDDVQRYRRKCKS